MTEEKRMIGNYEVLHDIRICGKDVIIGENPSAKQGERYVVATGERAAIYMNYVDSLVSDDYAEIMKAFGERVSAFADELVLQHTSLVEQGIPIETILPSEYDCIFYGNSILNKIVIIDTNVLSPEYRIQAHQVYLCVGGNGSAGCARGSACFCISLYDGKTSRFERADIAGVIQEEKLPLWARNGLEKIQAKRKEKSMEAR